MVDTRTNETDWLGVQTRTFTVASPSSFMKYRLNITDDNDPTSGIVVVSMGRLDLFGCPQAHCGYQGESCCTGQTCSGVLTCVSNTCQLLCGYLGESCCLNQYCIQGSCSLGRCQLCGTPGLPCCSNYSCNFPSTCNSSNFCQ